MVLIKLTILTIFFIILYCLGSAAYYLTKTSKKDRAVVFVKMLTWRIIFALCLFFFLFIAFYFGWIQPHYPV